MSAKQTPEPARYSTARDDGEVTHQSGYHQPGSGYRGRPRCGCDLDTDKGAYRDVTAKMPDGRTVHFYHQSPVVTEHNGAYRLSSCGYRTSTTKERINRYLPSGYRVVQRDYEWYLETPNGRRDFEDGMVIEP